MINIVNAKCYSSSVGNPVTMFKSYDTREKLTYKSVQVLLAISPNRNEMTATTFDVNFPMLNVC